MKEGEPIATTGFWLVKDRLDNVLEYAENLDKTTDAQYLDNDLSVTLQYAENERKTD